MDTTKLSTEEILAFIDDIRYCNLLWKSECLEEDFEVIFKFLEEEIHTEALDEKVLFAFMEMVVGWDLLEKYGAQFLQLFKSKSQFIRYLSYYREHNEDEECERIVLQQITLWNELRK